MKKKSLPFSFFLLFLFTKGGLLALRTDPWFYQPYEFHLGGSVEGSYFSNVNKGVNPIGYHSTNLLLRGYLIGPVTDVWEIEGEVELERTSKTPFNFQSFALQVRRQLLNDITYDWVSASLGFNCRFVQNIWLHDVAIPYHNLFNFELIGSIGKEFTKNFRWKSRTFLYLTIGQASRGYPWVRGGFESSYKVLDKSILTGFIKGYFGLGPNTIVNVDHFKSYAAIKHQSVDLGLKYSYIFDILGCMTLEYSYRVYAKSFPQFLNCIKLSYDYPFGF